MALPILKLNKHADRRLRQGHLWIYSNEVNTTVTPLKNFKEGEQVAVHDASDQFLGNAYVNPHTLISARIISRKADEILNQALLTQRLQHALQLRQLIFTQPYYRLVFAEGDFLPGLIIDRFKDDYVVQINTAGIERVKEELIQAMQDILKPQSILYRNDGGSRELEQIDRYVSPAMGKPPQLIQLEENGCQFQTSPWKGQKTGWFYDHRQNRMRLNNYVVGKKVLDVFSYIGGWGILAAKNGANHVMCIDSSANALEQLKQNAKLNDVADKITTLEEDVFKALKNLASDKEAFDVIILDPPAFIKKRKDIKEGQIAYQRLNEMAMKLLAPAGILISASCSMHLSNSDLLTILQKTAQKAQRSLQILEQGHQAPDHPIHPAIIETNYLKAFITRVL